jgi:hypothetical protein
MKFFYALILTLSFNTLAETTPSAKDMKFVTSFKNYACKSFRDQTSAPYEIAELEVEFTKLGVSADTRRAIMDIQSLDGECSYSADFSRQKGFKVLKFEASYTNDTARCLDLKGKLDEILMPGFRYVVKYNAYLSVLLNTKLTGACEEVSGHHLIEFHWL